jgi:adenosylcobinamide-phosphate synthase
MLGRALGALERRTYVDRRSAGVVHAAAGAALGAAAGAVVGSTAAVTQIAVAGRMLGEVATDVAASGDLEAARAALPALVGRDPRQLDGSGIARAVIESVAENAVDAVVAPAFWAAVGGAAAVGAHKAVSTLDSMVGHRNPRYERFGWASARLDDALAFVPARLTAALVAAVRPRQAADVWRAVRRDAPAHPSPNAGVAEAAVAAALGLQLGGELRYGDRVEHRPLLGAGRPPTLADVDAAVRLLRDVQLATAGALAVTAAVRRRRRPRP